jgi:O-antigen/teichoic acid export membrane protein
MFQKVASLRNGEGNATVAGAMRHVMFLAVATGLTVALVAWLLIGIIWGESYMPARELVYILIAGNILNSGLIILSTHFIGQRGKPLSYSMMLLAGLIANIAGAVLLIPEVGIVGAAAAYAVSQAIAFSTAVYFFRKGTDMRLSDMLLIKREEREFYLEYIKRLGGLR